MKRVANLRSRRRGAILPLVVISLVALMAFVAMAIDLGMIAVARTQAQNVADTAAMTAVRTLNGSSTPNLTAPAVNAQLVAAANHILSDPIPASEVVVVLGAYHYDPAKQTFVPQYPPVPPDSYNLASATISHNHPSPFSSLFGAPTFNVTATAVAAYRPRDVAIVLDYSGSMNNESDLWNAESYVGSFLDASNNADPIYPQFGPYDPGFSPLAAFQQTSTDPRVGLCNVSQGVLGVAAMVNDYYQNARGATLVPAFNPAPTSVTVTNNGGDQYQSPKGGSGPALTWKEITGSSTTAFTGYPNFKGYIQGPGYWGMTFFVWPPDPSLTNNADGTSKDWRKRFFLLPGGSYPNFGRPMNDNTKLFSGGSWNGTPSGNYVINYKAILAWIKANCVQSSPSDPKPFPPMLRAGRVLFYDAIPTDVPAQAYDHTQINANIAWPDQNTRIWKEYIDYVIGVWRDPYGNVQNPTVPSCSMGGDTTVGSSTGGQGVSITGPDNTQGNLYPNGYISPTDNPKRPRHRFWFGPMTMIQFLSDTGLFPGTAHDISMSPAKLGINGALLDIQNNHPNDLVSMILYSRPQYTNDPPGTGAFNNVQYALGRDYSNMISSLWYPANSSVADVRPWDASGTQTPRAHADYNANTATSYGFMLAYNQLSSNATLRTIMSDGQAVGGLGRVGAERIVVLETDGMANVNSTPANGFANNGPNNSYYHILPGDTVNGEPYDPSEILSAVQAICNKADGTPGTAPGYSPNPGYPGYATTAKPVLVHTLAFGAIFEPTASGGQAASAVTLLQNISSIGGTVFPSSSSDPVNGYKWCIGTLAERQSKLQQAFTIIMDSGQAVTPVK
jgi:hypothetical protein